MYLLFVNLSTEYSSLFIYTDTELKNLISWFKFKVRGIKLKCLIIM